ncbi:AAA family ATPase, partial [[Eubacterium] siraeum]|nr:AAA family ATPase [[Eubacterium] siraeum]
FSEGDTLIFFDELQACPNCATSLIFFKQDGRYDVICSGSLMGINYKQIESNSVGYKEDYEMYSMDFEEFLWAKGYKQEHIDALYKHMLELKPFSET